MKLIIDILDEDYKHICKIAKDLKGRAVLPTDWKAIANGTPYNPTGDCISREDLKKALNPQIKQGEWKKLYGQNFYCSNCKKEREQNHINFCGYCGADMRGGA